MHELALESAVEDVIRQFADPLAFLRELIQNAIDAGSQDVEVIFSYDEERGIGTVSVQDWGEGMTREIVESQLVRLFNSAKDDDYTKIGKFGIGFVSVFAVQPEVVCVDTGRDGEYWRILFHPDRSYELFELPHPVEGTEVRVMMRSERAEFDELRSEGTAKIHRWCRFVPVDVRVDGEAVQAPFELDGLVAVTFEEEGSRGVAALRSSPQSQGRYFNAGLFLQQVPSPWPHVAFMLDSRYLEHTLTRDRVLQDKNFHQAVERLDALVHDDLRAATEHALANWAGNADTRWDWNKVCEAAATAFDATTWECAHFPLVGGELADTPTCKRARSDNRLMKTRGQAHFAHLMPDDYVLLDVRPDSGADALLRVVVGRDVPVLEDVWIHVPVTAPDSSGAERLLRELDVLLHEIGASHRSIAYGTFDYPYSGLENRAFLAVAERREPQHRGDLVPFDPFTASGDVLVNLDHEAVEDAVSVADVEPEWAAYTLLKAAALATEAVEEGVLDEETDVRLAMFCLDRRELRLGHR